MLRNLEGDKSHQISPCKGKRLNDQIKVLDLFSGIGGFSLGLERAGMRTVAFCEIDPYCRRVLAKHWPDVPIFGDIRDLTGKQVLANADSWRQRNSRNATANRSPGSKYHAGTTLSDAMSISSAAASPARTSVSPERAQALTGERRGLWTEYARIIGELRPRYVIVENVAALLGRGLGVVLGDLAALGYDAEWHCIPASAVGAPHRRDRIWIVAYPCGTGPQTSWPQSVGTYWRQARGMFASSGWWSVEPDVGRVAHGVPSRVHRLRALGNAVVPQIPEIIGRAIMEFENANL